MTFCSDEQDKIKTIKNIEIDGNKYIINYFNNNKVYGNNFIQNKNNLENLMINQAKEREKEEYITTHINSWGSIITWFLCCRIVGNAILDGAVIISLCFLIACSILLNKHRMYTRKLNELKKYKILLDNYDEIKNNPTFYKKIKLHKYKYFIENNVSLGHVIEKNQKDGFINIFNIDEFNLKDMKLLKKEMHKRI